MQKLYLFIMMIELLLSSATLPVYAQPDEQESACPGSLPSRLAPGMVGRVTPGDPNNLRDQPSLVGSSIGSIPGGASFQVLEGPACADGYTWYRVDYNGTIGWTVEGADVYWLEPVESSNGTVPTIVFEDEPAACPPPTDPRYVTPRLDPNTAARVIADVPLRVRTEPRADASFQYQLPPGVVVWIGDGPLCADGFTWWRVAGLPYFNTWVAEGQNGEYWLEPLPTLDIPAGRASITTLNADRVTALGVITFKSVDLFTLDITTSADGTPWLAVAIDQGDIILQNLLTMQTTTLVSPHTGPVKTLAFDSSGTMLVSGGDDGTVQLRDIQSPEEPRFTWDHGSPVKRVIFNGMAVAAAGGSQVHIWDAVTGENITAVDVPKAKFIDIAFSPDGTRLAAASSHVLPSLDPLAKMPDCVYLDCYSGDYEIATIHLWDLPSEQELPYITVHYVSDLGANALTFMTFNKTSQRLITSDITGMLQQWSVNTLAEQTGGVDVHMYAPTIRLSHDQSWAAVYGEIGSFNIIDMPAGELIAQPLMSDALPESQDDLNGMIFKMALSPDEALIATIVSPNQVIIWGIPESGD